MIFRSVAAIIPAIFLAACVSDGGETPKPQSAPALSEAGCPAVPGYNRQILEASLAERDADAQWDERARRLADAAPLPSETANAKYRFRVNVGTIKAMTYWKDEKDDLWRMASTNPFKSVSRTPPPPAPPPPPPPPGASQDELDAYEAEFRAYSEQWKNPPPPKVAIYELTPEYSAELDKMFFNPCLDAGPDHIPGYFDTEPFMKHGRELQGYFCPSDGLFWAGDIIKPGAEIRYVSSGCINDFALTKLLRNSGYPDTDEVAKSYLSVDETGNAE